MTLAHSDYNSMDDTCPIKRCRLRKEEYGLSSIFWPPDSPELNPIETVWAAIERQLRSTKVSGMEVLAETVIRICS